MKKKIIALLMCAVMVVGILPVYAFAEDNMIISSDGLWKFQVNNTNGNYKYVTIYEYLGESDTVVVPAIIDEEYTVLWVHSNTFFLSNIKNAILSEGIEGMGVTLYGGLSYLDVNSGVMLETLVLPTSLISINSTVLSPFDNLKQIIVSNDNYYFTSENGVLYSKDMHTLIKYPSQKQDSEFTVPETVTKISDYAFVKCSNLKKVTLGDNVKSAGDYFLYNCPLLEEVNLNEGLEYLFEKSLCKCNSLETLKIPDSVLRLNADTAAYCNSLKSVEIGTGCIAILNGCFCNCPLLERAVILNSKTAINGSSWYSKEPFRNCSKLIIYGYIDSTAQTFAGKYNHRFIYLDDVIGGDLNNDGILGIDDYSELKELLSGVADYTNYTKVVSDINGDGAVDAFDLFEIDKTINA